MIQIISDFFISPAYAEGAAAGQQGSGMGGILFLVTMIGLMYFLMIRPQAKRAKEHRKMIEALAAGDEVVTNGGILAKISKVTDNYFVLRITEGVEIKLQKHAVGALLPKGTVSSGNTTSQSKGKKKAKPQTAISS